MPHVRGSRAATAERFVCPEDRRRLAASRNRRPQSATSRDERDSAIAFMTREAALMRSEIFQLFPDGQSIDACQVRGVTDGAETFRAMAMVAASGEQHSPESISARGGRDRLLASMPHRTEFDAADCLALAARETAAEPAARQASAIAAVSRHGELRSKCADRSNAPHNCPFLPAVKQGTVRAERLSTRTAWRSVRLRRIRGKAFDILPDAGTEVAPR